MVYKSLNIVKYLIKIPYWVRGFMGMGMLWFDYLVKLVEVLRDAWVHISCSLYFLF